MSAFRSESLAHAQWRKSSLSGDGNDTCVEVADLPGTVAVRDSTDPEGPKLAFGRDQWRAFADQIRAGTLDL